MPGNPHVRFDEGRVGRHLGARPLSYSPRLGVEKISPAWFRPDGPAVQVLYRGTVR